MSKTILMVVLLALLSGCAFTEMKLNMPMTGLETSILGGNGREISVVIPFSDARPSPKRCGMKKNGYNMDTADAICKIPPGKWLSQLLADELRASGFKVIKKAKPQNKNTLVIEGKVSKVFVEPVIGMWSGSLEADLDVNLVATTQSGLKAERHFFSKGIKKGVFAIVQTPYQTSLKRAADSLLANMVEAIFYLMNSYPQLGISDSATELTPNVEEQL